MQTVKVSNYQPAMGGRSGTAVADYERMRELFGEPHHFAPYRDYESPQDGDGKVTTVWTFKTPRGIVHVRDYWWNGEGEWSIGAESYKAALHVCRALRRAGIPASTRFMYGRDARLFSTV
jgi:hypothetical protein